MAQLKMPPIPVKMYRHFAVVTIALTGVLALFADGENREIVETHLAERQQQAELRRISAERAGPRVVAAGSDMTAGSFPDDAGSFGAPTDTSVSGGGGRSGGFSSPNRPPQARARSGPRRAVIPGYAPEYTDGLGEADYRQLASGFDQSQLVSQEQRQRQIEALQRNSAQRSGSGTSDM